MSQASIRPKSRNESESKENDDCEITSKLDSKIENRKGSVLDFNPHYKKSVINSIVKPAENNEMTKNVSVLSSNNPAPVILASND